MNSSSLLRSAIVDSCDGLRADVLVLNRLGNTTCRPESKVRILIPEEDVEAPQHVAGRRLSQQSRAQTLLRGLSRPSATCAGKLVRRGAKGDGGYVLCELLPIGGSDCLIYSFGIKDQFEFENEAVRRGCTVHGYDPTVARRADMRFHFHRLGLGDAPRHLPGVGPVSTLSKMMAENGHSEGRQLTLFKCDVEGAEWGAFGQMSDAQLLSLGHVIIELHLTTSNPRIGDDEWMQRFAPTVARLRRLMDLYRAHANNCGGFRNVGGVMIPMVWELSFAQKGKLPQLPEAAPSRANAADDAFDKPVCGTTAFTRQWVTADLECECASGDASSCSCRQRPIPFAGPMRTAHLRRAPFLPSARRPEAPARRHARSHWWGVGGGSSAGATKKWLAD